MPEYRQGGHTVDDIQDHRVWATQYRDQVWRGEVAERIRDILRQGCMSRELTIIEGHVSVDQVHILGSCPPTLSPAKIVQDIQGVSSRKVQEEFSHVQKRYGGQPLGARG